MCTIIIEASFAFQGRVCACEHLNHGLPVGAVQLQGPLQRLQRHVESPLPRRAGITSHAPAGGLTRKQPRTERARCPVAKLCLRQSAVDTLGAGISSFRGNNDSFVGADVLF